MILWLTSCRPRALRSVVHLTAEQTAAQELQLMEHIGSAGWKVTCRNLVCTGCCSRALRPIVRLGSTSYIATCMILGLTSCRPRALQSVVHQCFTCRLVLSSSQKKSVVYELRLHRLLVKSGTNNGAHRSSGWSSTCNPSAL